ncbi:unnamed protein product [Amoebophrya sp. A120]|nr:unnamed protein product [Amoebophrya sp. A120]|eukprot:GSA120T00016902001.1
MVSSLFMKFWQSPSLSAHESSSSPPQRIKGTKKKTSILFHEKKNTTLHATTDAGGPARAHGSCNVLNSSRDSKRGQLYVPLLLKKSSSSTASPGCSSPKSSTFAKAAATRKTKKLLQGTEMSTSMQQQELQPYKCELRLGGMTCSACSGTIENMLRKTDGVEQAHVLLLLNKAVITYNRAKVTAKDLAENVDDIGFDAEVVKDHAVATNATGPAAGAAAPGTTTADPASVQLSMEGNGKQKQQQTAGARADGALDENLHAGVEHVENDIQNHQQHDLQEQDTSDEEVCELHLWEWPSERADLDQIEHFFPPGSILSVRALRPRKKRSMKKSRKYITNSIPSWLKSSSGGTYAAFLDDSGSADKSPKHGRARREDHDGDVVVAGRRSDSEQDARHYEHEDDEATTSSDEEVEQRRGSGSSKREVRLQKNPAASRRLSTRSSDEEATSMKNPAAGETTDGAATSPANLHGAIPPPGSGRRHVGNIVPAFGSSSKGPIHQRLRTTSADDIVVTTDDFRGSKAETSAGDQHRFGAKNAAQTSTQLHQPVLLSPNAAVPSSSTGPQGSFRSTLATVQVDHDRSSASASTTTLVCIRYYPDKVSARQILQLARQHLSREINHDYERFQLFQRHNKPENIEATELRKNCLRSMPFALAMLVMVFVLPHEYGHTKFYKYLNETQIVPGLHVKTVIFLLLATPVQFIFGARFHRGARKAWKNKTPNMDVLVSVAATVSYAYSVLVLLIAIIAATFFNLDCRQPPPHFFEAPTTLIAVLLGGKYLEVRTKQRTVAVLERLLQQKSDKNASDGGSGRDTVRVVTLVSQQRTTGGSIMARTSSSTAATSSSSTSAPSLLKRKIKAMPLELLHYSDRILLKPGDRVPVDGVITADEFDEADTSNLSNAKSASSTSSSTKIRDDNKNLQQITHHQRVTVDEALLTGESQGVIREVHQTLYAGSFVLKGSCYLQPTRIGSKTMLSEIASMVKDAQSHKPEIERMADKIARKFVPAVMLLAFCTTVIWLITVFSSPEVRAPENESMDNMMMQDEAGTFFAHAFDTLFALKFGLAVLLVACPCAMGLATPTAILVATGVAAERGIFLKGGFPLESGARKGLKIVLDKTGTLTEGRCRVVESGIYYDVSPPASDTKSSVSSTKSPVQPGDGADQVSSTSASRTIVVRTGTLVSGTANTDPTSSADRTLFNVSVSKTSSLHSNQAAVVASSSSPAPGADADPDEKQNYKTAETIGATPNANADPPNLVIGKPVDLAGEVEVQEEEDRQRDLWHAVAALEDKSEHPLAVALVAYARKQTKRLLLNQQMMGDDSYAASRAGVDLVAESGSIAFSPNNDIELKVRNFENVAGRGIQGEVLFPWHNDVENQWRFVKIGSAAFVLNEENKGQATWSSLDGSSTMTNSKSDRALQPATPGSSTTSPAAATSTAATLIYVSIDGIPFGWAAVADKIRPNVAKSIAKLQQEFQAKVYLCTGDARPTAVSVATEVGIPLAHVRAECLPQDKAAFVQELQALPRGGVSTPFQQIPAVSSSTSKPHKKSIVFFVGDGLNDAAALAAADAGLAIGCGASVSVHAADVVLVKENLGETLVPFLQLARKTMATIKLNFFWAFCFNFLMLPLAAGVFYQCCGLSVPPLVAGTAMASSSTLVLLSSLQLRYVHLSDPAAGIE